jgi:putative transcriptional regulator
MSKPLKYTINDLLPEINALLKFTMVDLSNKTIISSTIYQELLPNSIEISNGIIGGGDSNLRRQITENKQKITMFPF